MNTENQEAITTKMNPLDNYLFQNVGQARAVMATQGYVDNYDYKNDKLTFSKGNDVIESSFAAIREQVTAIKDKIEPMQLISKEEVAKVFNKERATNDFENYKNTLEKDGITLYKWDDLKVREGKPMNENQSKDGFTIIDHKNKVCYTGKSLYDYAQENGYSLNPEREKQVSQSQEKTQYEIVEKAQGATPLYSQDNIIKTLSAHGVNVDSLTKDNLEALSRGEKTAVVDLSIKESAESGINLKGKLELSTEPGGALSVTVHPERSAPKNMQIDGKDINLDKLFNQEEKENLAKGWVVNKEVSEIKEKVLFQFDKEINNYVAAKEKDIKINIPLDPLSKVELMQGKTIRLNTENGTHLFKIDLLEPTGSKLKKAQDQSQDNIYKNNIQQSPKTEGKQVNKDIARALIAGLLFGMPLVGVYFLLRDVNKKDIDKYKLDSKDLSKLLDGKKTDIKKIDNVDARLSLQRKADNTAEIKLHPVQQDLKTSPAQSLEQIKSDIDLLQKVGNTKDRDGINVLYNHFIAKGEIPLEKTPQLDSFLERNNLQNEFNKLENTSIEVNSVSAKSIWHDAPEVLEKYKQDLPVLQEEFRQAALIRVSELEKIQEKQIVHNSLTPSEFEKLQKGETISKDINNEKYIVQADLKTNEILTAKEKDIPSHIRDIELSSQQKEDLKKGLPIDLDIKGEKVSAQLDLNSMGLLAVQDDRKQLIEIALNGIKGIEALPKAERDEFLKRHDLVGEVKNIAEKSEQKEQAMRAGDHAGAGRINKDLGSADLSLKEQALKSYDQQQKIDFDRANPGVVSYLPTDENRAEYMAVIQKNEQNISVSNSLKM